MNPKTLYCAVARPSVIEQLELQPRSETLATIPAPFHQGKTASSLSAMLGGRDMIWHHQALALRSIAAGDNVVVSTGTASGKSLIFQIPILHELLQNEGRALVLYPQKALGGDQLVRWRAALALAGLPIDLVGEINGDVAMSARAEIIGRSRIILATPDVVHAWLMRHVAMPAIRQFLAGVRFLVIDEAHVLDGAFGSNSAFLFRRLQAAHARARKQLGLVDGSMQFVAATATVSNAADHLRALTGCSFVEISEADNGAPCQHRTIVHVDGQAIGESAEKALAETLSLLADQIGDDAFIAFADSRQGVERIARFVGREDVLPYRSGYEGTDRREIEEALRAGHLRGVVSTSALELGIDIPQFTIGLNLGIPLSRKALRQRIGRVGRAKPGLFVLIAPSPSFAQLGTSLHEFYEGSVEPSHLYTSNEIIQFAQARCLRDEMDVGFEEVTLPAEVTWPEGFAASAAVARPGAPRSPSLDQVAAVGGDSPHLNYPIRNICEPDFSLKLARGDEKVGTIPLSKALREAYPGAVYFHLRRAHRVVEWRTTTYDHSIRLEPIKAAEITKPLLRTQVDVSTGSSEIIDGRLLGSDRGSLAEIQLRVSESVEGYRSGAATLLYSDLKERDSRMRRRTREIGSTGILIRITEPWFAGRMPHQIATRKAVARAFEQLLASEHSIAPGDIAYAHTGIALHDDMGAKRIDDAIVLFDSAAGGLRLSAPLYNELPQFIDRLRKAAITAGTDALLSRTAAEQLHEWYISLRMREASLPQSPEVSDGDYVIYAPQSEVGVRHGGLLQTRTIVAPRIVSVGDQDMLMYMYESAPGTQAFVPHHLVEPIGEKWRRVLWNASSNETRELEL